MADFAGPLLGVTQDLPWKIFAELPAKLVSSLPAVLADETCPPLGGVYRFPLGSFPMFFLLRLLACGTLWLSDSLLGHPTCASSALATFPTLRLLALMFFLHLFLPRAQTLQSRRVPPILHFAPFRLLSLEDRSVRDLLVT